jgi:hypothetical protein
MMNGLSGPSVRRCSACAIGTIEERGKPPAARAGDVEQRRLVGGHAHPHDVPRSSRRSESIGRWWRADANPANLRVDPDRQDDKGRMTKTVQVGFDSRRIS